MNIKVSVVLDVHVKKIGPKGTIMHNCCLKLSKFLLMAISADVSYGVTYLSSVLGISLSKVCKVVLSRCLCINTCMCQIKIPLPLYISWVNNGKACFVDVNSNAKGCIPAKFFKCAYKQTQSWGPKIILY